MTITKVIAALLQAGYIVLRTHPVLYQCVEVYFSIKVRTSYLISIIFSATHHRLMCCLKLHNIKMICLFVFVGLFVTSTVFQSLHDARQH